MGNDFLPHFPALNIRTNGISILLETYKHCVSSSETICCHNNIDWRKYRQFIQAICKQEHNSLLNEYRIRQNWSNRKCSSNTPADKLKKFNEIPFRSRDTELFIDPYSDGWQHRYYSSLFHMEINNTYRKQISVNYLEGMIWTLRYYTSGCMNYQWYYKYDYPPLLEDLVRYIPEYNVIMLETNMTTIHPYVQLAYVLPRQSLHLLPSTIRSYLLSNFDEYYRTDIPFEWSFCKYFWESHPRMKFFTISQLQEIIKQSV